MITDCEGNTLNVGDEVILIKIPKPEYLGYLLETTTINSFEGDGAILDLMVDDVFNARARGWQLKKKVKNDQLMSFNDLMEDLKRGKVAEL